jgi:hypothetical protein
MLSIVGEEIEYVVHDHRLNRLGHAIRAKVGVDVFDQAKFLSIPNPQFAPKPGFRAM